MSGDGTASHASFAKRLGLPFKLVSDSGGALRKSWEVPRVLGLLPGRVTYVLDKQGVVRKVFIDNRNPAKHIAEALEVIRSL